MRRRRAAAVYADIIRRNTWNDFISIVPPRPSSQHPPLHTINGLVHQLFYADSVRNGRGHVI